MTWQPHKTAIRSFVKVLCLLGIVSCITSKNVNSDISPPFVLNTEGDYPKIYNQDYSVLLDTCYSNHSITAVEQRKVIRRGLTSQDLHDLYLRNSSVDYIFELTIHPDGHVIESKLISPQSTNLSKTKGLLWASVKYQYEKVADTCPSAGRLTISIKSSNI